MTQPIFNSLGSNYDSEFVATANSFQSNPTKNQQELSAELTSVLEARFSGRAILTYKGRDAIELALRPLADTHSNQKIGVLTQGLACHAIEEGIVRAGLVPIYADLERGTLSPSVKTLEAAYALAERENVGVKAVFLQNTLGYANPVKEIEKFCRSKNLVLIEDLAQSFGGNEAGKELGTTADVVICSFGRDKVLDAVSGGAVIYKKEFWQKVKLDGDAWVESHLPVEFPPEKVVSKEMLYPGLVQFIRKTNQSGVGKVTFQLAKLLGMLTSPISTPVNKPTKLPAGYVSLVLLQLKHLDQQLAHRRELAQIYFTELKDFNGVKILIDPKNIESDAHLRVPLLFHDAKQLKDTLKYCVKNDVYITDRWYREVVDSGSLHYPSVYKKGSCPEAEKTAEVILNLPTHRNISAEDARRVANTIKASVNN